MDIEEIRLRRLAGQHLIATADTLSVVRDLCGVQAQFMSNALHALRIRSSEPEGDGLVKNWTIRGTVHVFAESDLPLFIRAGDYRKMSGAIPTGGIPVPTGRLARSGKGISRTSSSQRWPKARARERSSGSSAGLRA